MSPISWTRQFAYNLIQTEKPPQFSPGRSGFIVLAFFPSKFLEDGDVFQALEEVFVGVFGVEYGDAFDGVDVGVGVHVSVFDSEGSFVAGFFYHVGYVEVVGASGICHEVGFLPQLLLDIYSGVYQLHSQLLIGKLCHGLVVHCVGLYGDAVVLQFSGFFPGEIVFIFA